MRAQDKRSIRREALARRDALAFTVRKAKDQQIRFRLTELSEFQSARTILLYASFRTEVDTFEIIRQSLAEGKHTVLPRVDREAGTLRLFEILDIRELSPGCWGIPEPPDCAERMMDVAAMDLIVLPGVSFDERCNRLGYGKAYYDRLLAVNNAPAFGLSYDEQIVPLILAESHDVRMDAVITDQRELYCHG